MEIKIESIKEMDAGHGAVKVVAELSCVRGGRDWKTYVSGQGESRKAAVENLAKNKKLTAAMGAQLRASLDKLQPEQIGSPKEPKPSTLPEQEGQNEKPSGDLPQAGTQVPSSVPAPPVAKEAPGADPETLTQTQDGTPQEEKSEDNTPEEDPQEEDVPGEDGIPQEEASEDVDPMGEF